MNSIARFAIILFFLPLTAAAQSTQAPSSPNTITTLYPNEYYSAVLGAAGTTTKQIYAGDTLIATVEVAAGKSAIQYVHPDLLGSTNAVTDTSGKLVESSDYFPYGKVREDATSGYTGEDRKFIGQVYDPAASLSYLNARYYDGTRGQFLSEDPQFWSRKQNLGDPQTLNAYSYASDNPVAKSDPTGLLTIVVPGTSWDWDTPKTMCTPSNTPIAFIDAVGKTFNETPTFLSWSGKDDTPTRTDAAKDLAGIVNNHDFKDGEQLNIVGYSHGGNVAIQASNMNLDHKVDTLVTIGTPARSDYQPNEDAIGTHINAYSSFDFVQGFLGGNIGIYYPEVGPAGRTYPGAQNLNVTYETSPRPLESHYNLPSTQVWERIDALLKADTMRK